MGIEDALRFDQYSVRPSLMGMKVIRLMENVDHVFAAVLAEVTQDEFEQSITHTGWVGSSPDWLRNMPVVTVPKGDLLSVDHLDFMLEVLELQ
jgi:hypothetical protein